MLCLLLLFFCPAAALALSLGNLPTQPDANITRLHPSRSPYYFCQRNKRFGSEANFLCDANFTKWQRTSKILLTLPQLN